MAEQTGIWDEDELPRIEKPFKPQTFSPIRRPIWTENKARLIERYLYYFVLVTHHGTYIDGFAGPQEPDKPESWAAKLVSETKPPWLRNFFLCEKSKKKQNALKQLVAEQPADSNRNFNLYHGDFNQKVGEILIPGRIREKEATFCLLDQRTFECHWSTLETLAAYKKESYKIELFYFLGASWLHRALSEQEDKTVLDAWWGNSGWASLQANRRVNGLADPFCKRFKEELGYRYAYPWPIFERVDGGKIMYYMIHATDHDAAPALMDRAYKKAVIDKEPVEQLKLEFAEWSSENPPT